MVSESVRIDPGTSVGAYVVVRRLAPGGTSVLYLARGVSGERVVLKMVPDVGTGAARARAAREARALAAVNHPGIVRVLETGEHEGILWIVTEYVGGTDLKRVLAERGALPIELALDYAIQATEALVAAHDAGVIHRDLTPSNLLITADGRVVLVDFAIARRKLADNRDGDVQPISREALGPAAYLSPEQLEHGLADERSDVWAVGCLLYEMAAGTPPFGRGTSSTAEAVLRDEPRFPDYVTGTIVHVVEACLRKSSFARVASARDLLVLLHNALDDPRSTLPPVAERASSGPRASTRPSARPSAPPPRTVPPPAKRSVSAHPPARPPSIPPSRLPAVDRTLGRSPSGTMRALVTPGRIKGTAIRAGVAWFGDTYGAIALERVVDLASPELLGLLRPGDPGFGLIASGWYDTLLIGELLELVERVAAPGDPEVFQARVAEAIARDNVGGVYRALFRLIASPPMLAANAQRVWRTYVDEGTMAVTIGQRGTFEARVTGWSRHHPAVCRSLRSMLEAILRAIGYTALVVERTECVALGDACCTFEGMWAI